MSVILERPPPIEDQALATWAFKLYLLINGAPQNTIALLGSSNVDMSSGSATIFTAPSDRVARIDRVLIRDASATLGTSYDFTNFETGVDLSGITASTGYQFINGTGAYTEIPSNTEVKIIVNTGTSASATVEVFGVLS